MHVEKYFITCLILFEKQQWLHMSVCQRVAQMCSISHGRNICAQKEREHLIAIHQ